MTDDVNYDVIDVNGEYQVTTIRTYLYKYFSRYF